MKKPKEISDVDSDLFRNTIGNIDKLDHDKYLHDRQKPLPVPFQKQLAEKSVLEESAINPLSISGAESGETLLFKRPGIQQKIFNKLRRGQFTIEAELDLHGMTVHPARQSLEKFIGYCVASKKKCVRIIHGKGHGSKDRHPVLKNKLNYWLRQYNNVLAFCSAQSNDGGTGAVYVLFKRQS